MRGRDDGGRPGGWTRARALRAALAGGALATGAVAFGAGGTPRTSAAAPSRRQDAEILNVFLLLERVQESFYREAVRRGRISGDLLEFARTAGAQETEHVAFLVDRLGGRAGAPPRTDFGDVVESEEAFRTMAMELEEAMTGAYIGQAANLTREELGETARMVSVEARHAAWIRDLAGENPAPRAADPSTDPAEALARLRDRGHVR